MRRVVRILEARALLDRPLDLDRDPGHSTVDCAPPARISPETLPPPYLARTTERHRRHQILNAVRHDQRATQATVRSRAVHTHHGEAIPCACGALSKAFYKAAYLLYLLR